MKEMLYTGDRLTSDVLYKGEYKSHKFAILSLGTHPTAYIENKLYEKCELRKIDDFLKVHGGVTYFGGCIWDLEEKNTSYIGWDYAHCTDFSMFCFTQLGKTHINKGKMWTTKEIYEDVKDAIRQMIVLENKLEVKNGV